MSHHDEVDVEDTFSLFDQRGDNKIFVSSLGDVLRAVGQNPTQADVAKCSAEFPSPDHRISFEQFAPILHMIEKKKDTSPPEDFIEGFRVFDKDQNGFISAAELRHLLTSLGERLSDEEVEQLLHGYEDPQGNVQYEEFVRGVMGQ